MHAYSKLLQFNLLITDTKGIDLSVLGVAALERKRLHDFWFRLDLGELSIMYKCLCYEVTHKERIEKALPKI